MILLSFLFDATPSSHKQLTNKYLTTLGLLICTQLIESLSFINFPGNFNGLNARIDNVFLHLSHLKQL